MTDKLLKDAELTVEDFKRMLKKVK